MVTFQAGDGMIGISLAGEGFPSSGTPLTVSGDDLPVLSTSFTIVGGYPAVLATVDLHSGVTPGHRTLIVQSGGERVYGSATLEILPPDGPTDADGDTVSDADEGAPSLDTDADTLPDYLDLDSDEDGLADPFEAGDADLGSPPRDTDGDTTPDLRDTDSDDDSLTDAQEGAPDTDSDGTPDYRDLDSDGDTLPDAVEAGDINPFTAPRDSDGDTLADFRDLDSDEDGLADGTSIEDDSDWDGDTLENFRDDDSDNGGEPDGAEVTNGRNPLDPSDDWGGLPGPVPDGTGGSTPLTIRRSGASGLIISFAPATGASSYRVYRGEIAELGAGIWDPVAGSGAGSCDTLGATSLSDPNDLADGRSFYYLAAGFNLSGEGSLGMDSQGAQRAPGSGCGPPR
jgi:hypothetical protein